MTPAEGPPLRNGTQLPSRRSRRGIRSGKEVQPAPIPRLSEMAPFGRKWDVFIAYSSKDVWYAESLSESFPRTDAYSLIVYACARATSGRSSSGRSRIVRYARFYFLTENIDQDWFAQSEYVHAIELARSGRHRIIPILIAEKASVPYGLDQLPTLRHQGWATSGPSPFKSQRLQQVLLRNRNSRLVKI